MDATRDRRAELAIWAYAFGYFACYVPYAALTKVLSDGLALGPALASGELLPATAVASLLGMAIFLSAMRWWRFATHVRVGPLSLPRPTRWTLLSGLGSAAVIVTTTLAYTFHGVSIVFMVLLMKGGVLALAPLVDLVSHRHVRWFSWTGLALSLAALGFTFSGDLRLRPLAAADVAVYLAAYFVRLRFMSKLGKTNVRAARLRYFVEEHMVAAPALLVILGVLAALDLPHLRAGFTTFLLSPLLPWALLVGLLSEGTGIFGGLILLDPRENSFSVPVNRASSVLASIVGSYALMLAVHTRPPGVRELLGAAVVVLAIVVLAVPQRLTALGRALRGRRSEQAGAVARTR